MTRQTRSTLEPPAIPPELCQQRPIPWQPVLGDRNGPRAHMEYAAYLAVMNTIGRLPRVLRDRFVGGCARIARRLDRSHSDAARAFLDQAFGPGLERARREELVLSSWRHILQVAISAERLARNLRGGRILDHFELDLHPDVERATRGDRGVLVVHPHIGHWEAAVAALPRIGFDPLYIIVRPQRNRPLSVHVQRTREAHGVSHLARHGALELAQKVLRAGGSVVLAPDQRNLSGVPVPFFGRPALTEQSHVLLMRRLRVPMVIGACVRTERPGRYRLEIPSVLWPEDVRQLSIEAQIERVNVEMEKLIRKYPEQYLWIHDRYKDAPEADDQSAPGSE